MRSPADTLHATKAVFHVVYWCKIVSTPVTLKSQCNDNNLTMFGVKYKQTQLNMCRAVVLRGAYSHGDTDRNTGTDTNGNMTRDTNGNITRNTNKKQVEMQVEIQIKI